MMNVKDAKTIVIWGLGIEGRASLEWLNKHYPDKNIILLDSKDGLTPIDGHIITTNLGVLNTADLIIKSPGISLYDPALPQGKAVTSLMNLWFSVERSGKTICITGTKGKSTVSALLHHVLKNLGQKSILVGNIGNPLTDADQDKHDYYVIETSSYQAANFNGMCDIAAITNLYSDHLNWHNSLNQYHLDKLNLLRHAHTPIVTKQAHEVALRLLAETAFTIAQDLTELPHNTYLNRQHNKDNAALVMTIARHLGFAEKDILNAMSDFKGLPHRQYMLGVIDDITYVDDSISTTPQSTIACVRAFENKLLTLIVGGTDRGIDYTPLTQEIEGNPRIHTVICLGGAGQRISKSVTKSIMAVSMDEAIDIAKHKTPKGGAILLSPAAASYDSFQNFKERGLYFAKCAGFESPY